MRYDLRSPVTKRQLDALGDDRAGVIQFGSALAEHEYALLGDWFADHPSWELRAYHGVMDLEFLRYFPTLRSFQADALYLTSIDGLRFLPDDLRSLGLGQTRKRMSLRPIQRFAGLRELSLEGQTKDIEVISELTDLRGLTLRSITLPDLSLLLPLTKLQALGLKLGGTKNLALLPELDTLEYLELWMVKGLSDLTPIEGSPRLEYLFLQSLRQVEALPDLSRLTSLHRVWIQTMKGITELSALRNAPALRQLAVVEMAHLQPDAFLPLVDHPTLQSLMFGLGSRRKDDAVQQLIDLPSDGDWQKALGWQRFL